MTPTNNGERRPSPKQLAYLRSLAYRAGQTFTYPHTAQQASREIRRLKSAQPSTQAERALERLDDGAAREDAVAIRGFETVGYGSNCRWSH
jgi:hypothetical protein